MNDWKKRQEQEEAEQHYWTDGTLKSQYTVGGFVPSMYDDYVTDGRATREFREKLQSLPPLTEEDLIKEDNDIFWGIFKLIFGTIGVLILILLFFHAFPLY